MFEYKNVQWRFRGEETLFEFLVRKKDWSISRTFYTVARIHGKAHSRKT